MIAVILNPTWHVPFRRTVERDAAGKILRQLVFKPREPQLLEGADLKAVEPDIGKALLVAAADKDGNPLNKPAKVQPEPEDQAAKRGNVRRRR